MAWVPWIALALAARAGAIVALAAFGTSRWNVRTRA